MALNIFKLLDTLAMPNIDAALNMGNGFRADVSVVATTNKTTVAYATATTQLLVARIDYSRLGAVIVNGATKNLNIQDGTVVPPGAAYAVEDGSAAIDGSWDAGGSGNAYVFEWTV